MTNYDQNILLVEKDITTSDSEVIVIPHSTNGFMTPGFSKFIDSLGMAPSVPGKAILGEVNLTEVTSRTDIKYIVFACTNDSGQSNYSILREIIYQLTANLPLPSAIRRIACPILGGGGAQLDPVKCSFVIGNAFRESVPNNAIEIALYTIDPKLLPSIEQAKSNYLDQSSLQLAFSFCLEQIATNSWVTETLEMKGYYMEKALDAFHQYLQFTPANTDFFYKLEHQFYDSTKVFQDFIKEFDPASEEAKFLEICGTLVAYIDRHAYNKKRWNAYEDKRTLAQSAVNQTNWINNLLEFRSNNNDHEKLPPNILNAFLYLENPERQLSILSETHRKYVSRKILDSDYNKETFPGQVDTLFKKYALRCNNLQNNGILYCRLLYSPSIKLLWLPKRQDKPKQEAEIVNSSISDHSEEQLLEEQDEIRMQNLQALIYSDVYAEVDFLNYEIYANVIAAFLTSPLTKPPLTIGIMAPWGKGKTSLMHFIVKKISGKSAANEKPPVKEQPQSAYKDIWKWLGQDGITHLKINPLNHPIVWFNAWKFQKNEQIWAGFAHEIITQLADQLSELDREKFWFRLNLKRIDKDKIKRDITFKFIQKAAWPLVTLAGGILLSLLTKLYTSGITTYPQIGNVLSPAIGGLSVIATTIWGWMNVKGKKDEHPDTDISKYILQPEYKKKMGYYSAVEEDLRHALEIVADKVKPPIIFIDDLDRCAPTTTAELVEAINLFVSGGISTCYFVIGQDAQIVAAALDVAYDKVGMKATNIDKHHGSLGWYFMEKFIQLQFNIPMLTELQSTHLMQKFFSFSADRTVLAPEDQAKLLQSYAQMEDSMLSIDNLDLIFTPEKEDLEAKIASFAPEKIIAFQDKVILRAVNSFDVVESDLQDILESVAPYLTNSPREIKRFANLFIFYQFMKYTNTCKGLRDINSGTLGKWLMIMIRWPQLVRAIQWDNEKNFFDGSNAVERANEFEAMVRGNNAYADWVSIVKLKTKTEGSWQEDRQLYDFFRQDQEEEEKLENAVKAGLW